MLNDEATGKYLLPDIMSPSDYAYVVLGKRPNQTSVIKYVNNGKLPSVQVELKITHSPTGETLRSKKQNWVKVPESERIINKQYQKNIRQIDSPSTKKRWDYILKIPEHKLPACPVLIKQKQVEKDTILIRRNLHHIFTTTTPLTKPIIIAEFMKQFSVTYPSIAEKAVSNVVGWMIRNKYLTRTNKTNQKDKRQVILKLTKKGKEYFSKILK